MRCPFCGEMDTQVKDSRSTEEGASIRRRRQCPSCGGRFTTFERIQLRELTVVKANNKQEPFEREKLIRSMKLSLQKRPVNTEQIEKIASAIVRQLESAGDSEVTTKQIGQMVMDALSTLDHVAYIRYASVYKDFRETADFKDFLKTIKKLTNSPQNEDESDAA